jgi:hypothetical protein
MSMQPIGLFAVAVGILCLVLIVVVSLRGPRERRRRLREGAFIPLYHPHSDNGGDDGDGGADGG